MIVVVVVYVYVLVFMILLFMLMMTILFTMSIALTLRYIDVSHVAVVSCSYNVCVRYGCIYVGVAVICCGDVVDIGIDAFVVVVNCYCGVMPRY